MAFFDFFKRNKNAAIKPVNVYDYASTTNRYTGIDATTFACVDKIATTIAGLSYGVYDNNKHNKLDNHWLYDLIKEPNAEELHSTFFYQLVRDYFAGGIFLYLYKNAEGKIISLFRLNPSEVFVRRDQTTNEKVFDYRGQLFYSNRVLHIPSRFNYNGLTGKSIFSETEKTFANAQNLDSYTENSFGNAWGKRAVVDVTAALPDITPQQEASLQEAFKNKYGNIENAGKPIIKKKGFDYSVLDTGTNDNRSQQLSENRQYQRESIAEVFGIPVKLLDGNVSGDVEAIYTLYLTNAIEPIATVLEEGLNKLIPVAERTRTHFEFNYNNVVKTSLTTRINAYSTQLNNGMITPNDIARKENMPTFDGGDYHYRNSALLPIREDIEEAMCASAKQKMQEVNAQASGTKKNSEADNIGSDKL